MCNLFVSDFTVLSDITLSVTCLLLDRDPVGLGVVSHSRTAPAGLPKFLTSAIYWHFFLLFSFGIAI